MESRGNGRIFQRELFVRLKVFQRRRSCQRGTEACASSLWRLDRQRLTELARENRSIHWKREEEKDAAAKAN